MQKLRDCTKDGEPIIFKSPVLETGQTEGAAVNCFPCKHKGLSWVPRTHTKRVKWV